MISTVQAFDLAWKHYRAGNLPQAAQLCRQIVQADARHVDALHLLGVIAGRTGQDARALDYLTAALRLKPDFADAHNSLGMVYVNQRKLAEAAASFRQAVRVKPDYAVAHNNLGNALRELGELAASVASFQEALRLQPDYAVAHFGLGIALQVQGKLSEAAEHYQRAVDRLPVHAEAQFHLGYVLLEQGQPAAATAHLDQAVRLNADYPEAHHSLGIALKGQGMLEDAITHFQQALRLKPDYADAQVNLGNARQEQGRLEEAVAHYRQALRLKPDHAEASNNLGNALREQGQLEEAEVCLRQALRLQPDSAEAPYNLGIVLWRQGRLEEAIACYQQAVRLQPGHAEAHLNLGNCFKDRGQLDEAIAAYRAALQHQPDAAHIHCNLVFALHYHPASDQRAIWEEARYWNDRHAEPLKKTIQPHANRPDPERRLRVGYVSPDFHEHPISSFTIPLLSRHDHRLHEIFCYANVERPDAFTQRLRGSADAWRSTVGLSDQQVAEMIRRDQIDVLVDLALHTANNRLLVFARKPAPVQVTWLGYPGTTGLACIDYRLTDPYLDPPGLFDAFYAEESIRLPDTFWCYDPVTETPPVNPLPARESGAITFGCLNNFCKINDGCLALWARVLQAVPRSRFLLRAPRGQARDHVVAVLQHEGIPSARVEFADRQPRWDYFELHHRIDLGLDPLPCNGGTTTMNAFWMGVPTLTLVGETVVGRAGWSQLCNLDLKELAAETPEQFVALAAQLASDLPRLQELRSTLRQRMVQSPLMDANRFTRHVEQAYREMWHRWCEGRQPERNRL
ncbi:MAG TPA: tetratricopeptide repeat protein [Isosphaeraceae bacterium]|nr:tetratricopeptide repeat protein [Isosphaeraceae bacterium]